MSACTLYLDVVRACAWVCALLYICNIWWKKIVKNWAIYKRYRCQCHDSEGLKINRRYHQDCWFIFIKVEARARIRCTWYIAFEAKIRPNCWKWNDDDGGGGGGSKSRQLNMLCDIRIFVCACACFATCSNACQFIICQVHFIWNDLLWSTIQHLKWLLNRILYAIIWVWVCGVLYYIILYIASNT